MLKPPLHGGHATGFQRRMVLAVEQLLDTAIEAGVAGDRDVGLALLLLEDRFLGALHAREHGRAPLLVLINADGQIDLAGVRIRAKQGHDPENRVGRQRLQCFEHD